MRRHYESFLGLLGLLILVVLLLVLWAYLISHHGHHFLVFLRTLLLNNWLLFLENIYS